MKSVDLNWNFNFKPKFQPKIFNLQHSVWKSQKESRSTLWKKRADKRWRSGSWYQNSSTYKIHLLFLPYSLLFENLKLCQNSLRWIAKNFKKIDVEEKSCDQKIFEKQVSESEQTNESNKWANEQVSEASKWAKQVKWERCPKTWTRELLRNSQF